MCVCVCVCVCVCACSDPVNSVIFMEKTEEGGGGGWLLETIYDKETNILLQCRYGEQCGKWRML